MDLADFQPPQSFLDRFARATQLAHHIGHRHLLLLEQVQQVGILLRPKPTSGRTARLARRMGIGGPCWWGGWGGLVP
eukprot:scaffold3493_cov84-Isochrysis_galbana.AAC.2